MRTVPGVEAPSFVGLLETAKTRLLARLGEASSCLSDGHLRILADLGEQIQSFMSLVHQSQQDLTARARRLGRPIPEAGGDDLKPWLELAKHIEQWEQRQAYDRRSAVEVLDRLLCVRHGAIADFAPLDHCHEEAQALREEIVGSPSGTVPDAVVDSLVSGTHRFCALLDLIVAPADVSDEIWGELRQRVEKSFPSKLAIAAERRFLSVSDDRVIIAESAVAVLPPDISTVDTKRQRQFIERTDSEAMKAPDGVVLQPSFSPSIEGKPEAALAQPPTQWIPTVLQTTNQPPSEQTQIADGTPASQDRGGSDISSEEFQAKPDQLSEVQQSVPLSLPAVTIAAPSFAAGEVNQHQSWTGLPTIIWQLLESGNYALAYHASDALSAFGEIEGQQVPPAWLLRALTLSPHIQSDEGHLAPLLTSAFAELKGEKRLVGVPPLSSALLLLAAGLRPALLAPGTYAPVLLKAAKLPGSTPSLVALQALVVEYAERNSALDLDLLRILRKQESWESALNALRVEVEQWLRRAPAFTTTYGPATQVWKRWVDNGGLLYSLATSVIEDKVALIDQVHSTVRALTDEVRFRKQVNETDRRYRTGGKDIEFTAREQLQSRTEEGLKLVRRWITIVRHRQNLQGGGYRLTNAARLTSGIAELAGPIRHELEGLSDKLELRAAVACFSRALDNLLSLFSPDSTAPVREQDGAMVLNAELLRMAELEMAEDWSLSAEPAQVLDALAMLGENGLADWEIAFTKRAEKGDLEGTELILNYLYAESAWKADKDKVEIETLLEDLRASRTGHQKRLYLEVQSELDRLRRDVDTAAALALLQDRGHDRYLSDIEKIEADIKQESFVRFRWARQRIAEILQRLEQLRAPFRSETERRLAPAYPVFPQPPSEGGASRWSQSRS